MSEDEGPRSGGRPFGAGRRRAVALSQAALVTQSCLPEAPRLPAVFEPAVKGLHLAGWAAANRSLLQAELHRRGAVLFRGFQITTAAEFEQFILKCSGELLPYTYSSTPRSHVGGRVYTSTEYPPDVRIPLHNEMSYTRSWPLRIYFFCAQASEQGGETPLADSRRVFERVAPEVREEFARKKVLYVRNYGERLDLPWQRVFQTTIRAEVEGYCRGAGIEFEWKPGDGLRTRQVCQAVARHPLTGEPVWFNQAHLFHVSGLPDDVRETLLRAVAEEDLPRQAYYGDGTPISPSALESIREAYAAEEVVFGWRDGDVLMLDNMLAAHGRREFKGARRVLVGMAEPFGQTDGGD